jgi:CRISPR-associated protein Cmr2
MRLYWQSKIFALLHDPVFKPFYTDKSKASLWRELDVMQDWEDMLEDGKLLNYLRNADYISAASDRGAIANIKIQVNCGAEGLEISHLLSGAKQRLQIGDIGLIAGKDRELIEIEKKLFPESIKREIDPKKVFWWLWRCLPTAVCKASNHTSLLLMPADIRIPDTSLWSHTSMTAALAGAAIGYQTTIAEFDAIPEKDLWYKYKSQPYLVSFSFAPVQELIKSSRKLRDFWAGSWILHYLSAKISWALAKKYGADSLLYPSLFHQPLIDSWLLKDYPDFNLWIKAPPTNSLLTAGFSNVLVLVLPQAEVAKAMQTAKQELGRAWKELGNLVLAKVGWGDQIRATANCWEGWLDTQWQSYWTGLPIGNTHENFKQSQNPRLIGWISALNKTYGLKDPNFRVPIKNKDDLPEHFGLFQPAELNFLPKNNPNIGSWWGYIFDNTRMNLTVVKNARNWQLPTVFSTRSTVSGIGAAVHNLQTDWVKESDVKQFWQHQSFLGNGNEQLNATEVIKRGLHHILPELLGRDDLAIAYPDLTSGVAGYLKTQPEVTDYYRLTCQKVLDKYQDLLTEKWQDHNKWGIPWAESPDLELTGVQPRLLNAGWLVEDLGIDPDDTKALQKSQTELNSIISASYPKNNPTDWYVLAAGDGDGMREWFKGEKLAAYAKYVNSTLIPPPKLVELQALIDEELAEFGKLSKKKTKQSEQPIDQILERLIAPRKLTDFLELGKRMGPSTHNALSRALLDFSNQLVPYLTETRYAGRLIYAGGDDVLAYTNLWEWDSWLWDIRQCFRGDRDPGNEFNHDGDYWQWSDKDPNQNNIITQRPLFTMGNKATISFGVVIAHQSIPLSITLENLWAAEQKSKEHHCGDSDLQVFKKDAVQVRVMYQNGNILTSTAKFKVFNYWQQLLGIVKELELKSKVDSTLFEQVAIAWAQHPAPNIAAIKPWCRAFCDRRAVFGDDTDSRQRFEQVLVVFMTELIKHTQTAELDTEMNNWLKLAAFTLRRREIALGGEVQ